MVAALNIPVPLAQALYTRGLRTLEEASAFLAPPPPADPFGLPDMPAAVERLARARDRGEAVLVFADYDCDGVCSAALAVDALRALGLEVQLHLPRREEGYGLQAETLPALARARGCGVVLTVDNGATAQEAVAAANRAGIDVVVTDHHRLGPVLPAAIAVVNPRRAPESPWTCLAGVGVVWALAEALATRLGRQAPAALDLVAIGTIADVVPLLGVNRRLVRDGLRAMAGGGVRPGVRALLTGCGLAAGMAPSARDISHGIAPRLNAPGRLEGPQAAYDLLAATGAAEAEAALAVVEASNLRRRALGAEVLRAAERALSALAERPRVVVLADAQWPTGLVGPAAATLSERLGVPVLLAGVDARGVCRGSGRAPAGWDLAGALERCAGLLLRHGGHTEAAGFELRYEHLDAFRSALCAQACPAEGWRPDGGGPERADAGPATIPAPARAEVVLDGVLVGLGCDLDVGLASALERLGPFGTGNPDPRFLLPAATVAEARRVGGEGRHVRLQLVAGDGHRQAGARRAGQPAEGLEGSAGDGGEPGGLGSEAAHRGEALTPRHPVARNHLDRAGAAGGAVDGAVGGDGRDGDRRGHVRGTGRGRVTGIAFGMGTWADGLEKGSPFDLVVQPAVNRYQGRETLQFVVHDLAPAGGDWLPFLAAARAGIARRNPDRDALAAVFRRLAALAGGHGQLPPDAALVAQLAPACLPDAESAAAAIAILRELGLLTADGRFTPPPSGTRLDLAVSARYRAAEEAKAAMAELAAAVIPAVPGRRSGGTAAP